MPEGWAWCRLEDCCLKEIKRGKSPKYSDTGNTLVFAQKCNTKYDGINIDLALHLDESTLNKYPNDEYMQNGDTVINSTGTGTLGRVGIYRQSDNSKNTPIVPDSHVTVIRTYPCINSDYIYYYLKSYQDELEKMGEGSTNQKELKPLTLKQLLLPLPPLKEQKLIINKLNEAMELVISIESGKISLQDIIKQTKSKILDLAIRGQLVPQDPNDEPASVLLERIRAEKEELIKAGKIKRDKKESIIFKGEDNSYYEKIGDEVCCIEDEIPFEIPDTWNWCRGFSCFAGMESKKPSGEFFYYIDIDSIDNHLHRIKEPKHLPVSDAPSRANRAVFNGSVLFSLVRPYLENIAFVDKNHANCIASTGFYICNSQGALFPEYMFYLMISRYVVDGLNQFMKGDNSPSICKDNIENWLYPIPPMNEQKMICHKLKMIIAKIETIEKSLN